MPYNVTGWIEVFRFSVDEEQIWTELINLDCFHLSGDMVSSHFFGLAKYPDDNPLYANRGIPHNSCEIIKEELKNNSNFIKKYGEGHIGHTHAYWSEIMPSLTEIDDLELKESEWHLVFKIIDLLTQDQFLKPDHIRIIVWGNW